MKEEGKNYFIYFIIIGFGITIDALARKGRNVLIKITDDRKLGDVNKDNIHGNTPEKSNAPKDWNGKKWKEMTE